MLQHETVLLKPTIDALQVHDGGIYVDATFGRGGHCRYLLQQAHHLQVLAFDRDQAAIASGQALVQQVHQQTDNSLTLIARNFTNLKAELYKRQIKQIDGICYDLGVSSPQFDDPQRGFSYRFNARLDMRMDQTQTKDAYQIVNQWDYKQLADILFRYGDEKYAKRIARLIVQQREQQPIVTTFQLVDLIKEAIPAAARRTGKNPAKRAFQALRIAVNDELQSLQTSLEQAIQLLRPHGLISVITFQSLEDRIVKQIFRKYAQPDVPRDLPVIPPELQPTLKIITKKPITADPTELEHNHRAHSAHLRIAQKLH